MEMFMPSNNYTGAHLAIIADLSKLLFYIVYGVHKSHHCNLKVYKFSIVRNIVNFYSTVKVSIVRMYNSIRLTRISTVYFNGFFNSADIHSNGTSSTCATTNKKPWVLRTKPRAYRSVGRRSKETWLWHGLSFTWFPYESEYETVPNSGKTPGQGLETYAHKPISIKRDTQAKCTDSLSVFVSISEMRRGINCHSCWV